MLICVDPLKKRQLLNMFHAAKQPPVALGAHIKCVTSGFNEFLKKQCKGNREGSYYRNILRWLFTHKMIINFTLFEMMFCVLLVAVNGEF